MIKIKEDVTSTARFSECGQYRYRLTRIWDESKDLINWLMMNPSQASDIVDDPTVSKCQRYARRWGFGGIIVTNCFALISTDPKALRKHPAPIGPANDLAILAAGIESTMVLAAWGNPTSFMGRGEQVYRMLTEKGAQIHCLKINKNRECSHPLYLREDLDPIPYIR